LADKKGGEFFSDLSRDIRKVFFGFSSTRRDGEEYSKKEYVRRGIVAVILYPNIRGRIFFLFYSRKMLYTDSFTLPQF